MAVPNVAEPKVTLQVTNGDVRAVLRTLFRQAGKICVIAPEVQGDVTADYKELALDDALLLVLRQVGATWRTESGLYQIVSRSSVLPGFVLMRSDPLQKTDETNTIVTEAPVVTLDSKFVYVVWLGTVYKLDKATLTRKTLVSLSDRIVRKPELRDETVRKFPIIHVGPDPAENFLVREIPDMRSVALASDQAFLYVVQGGVLSKVEKTTMKIVAKAELK